MNSYLINVITNNTSALFSRISSTSINPSAVYSGIISNVVTRFNTFVANQEKHKRPSESHQQHRLYKTKKKIKRQEGQQEMKRHQPEGAESRLAAEQSTSIWVAAGMALVGCTSTGQEDGPVEKVEAAASAGVGFTDADWSDK